MKKEDTQLPSKSVFKDAAEVLLEIEKCLNKFSSDDLLKDKIMEMFPIGSEISYSNNESFGSGIIVDRLILISEENESKDSEMKTNYLLSPVTEDPLVNDLYGSWNTIYDATRYTISVFVAM